MDAMNGKEKEKTIEVQRSPERRWPGSGFGDAMAGKAQARHNA
jgi:hypothetical protein